MIEKIKDVSKNDGKKELKPIHYFAYALCGLLMVIYLTLKDICPINSELSFIMCGVYLALPLTIIILIILILKDLMINKKNNGDEK